MKETKYRQHLLGRIIRTWIYRATLLLGIAQIALILLSWLLTAAMPSTPLQSMLSPGGIRWFFGSFALNLASPFLVNIILLVIAIGSMSSSGLGNSVRSIIRSQGTSDLSSQQWFAFKMSSVLLVIEIAAVLLLTLLPHAVLASITGALFPSSFSDSIIPIIAFMGTTTSIFFSLMSGRYHTVYEVGECMGAGGKWLMPLLLFYVFASEFYHSMLYVLNIS